MSTVSLEYIKAQEIVDILSTIIQTFVVKKENKGDEKNEQESSNIL